ncbi:VWA domain-containing protein [Sulfurimonas lithotrophica]|uniref:VWA domain-containing protein n=1 Tax=Sulfurimonas lithotrophica TaxID=2590022 RepID=A0A5P8P0H7_9BACT|nr:VWA domain-containing protein [Sulfurimonas lithotrophica]QFR49077.1 VWA domain-containing protein [Sulfurimonas lithotrophica]
MNFLNPEFFWLFLFLLAVYVKKDYKKFNPSTYGYVVTFIFIVIALSRPVIEQEPIKTKQSLNDVVIGVDLSYSMQGEDISPNRLSSAKEYLSNLVKNNTKTRFGVLGFTTNAIVLSPLTQDSELLLHLFNSLDESLIVTKGSSVMPALKLARRLSKSKKLSVVLLTDGGDELNYSDESEFAKENKMTVNIMMLATNSGSTLKLKNGDLLEDEKGDIVVSRANSAIKTIADATGGVYSTNFSDIISALSSQREANINTQVTIVQNKELFYYFIVLAILSFLVSVTSLKRFVIAFLILIGVDVQAFDYKSFYEANRLYTEGKYEKALQKYKQLRSSDALDKSIVFYNIANSYVRLKEFKKARENYMKSLTLHYSLEADENLYFIKDVDEEKQMSTGQQKSVKKSSDAKQKESSEKQKEGGGSNMNVSAASSSASDNSGKKVKSNQSSVDMSNGKAKLSSRQYELINKRGVSEKQPW